MLYKEEIFDNITLIQITSRQINYYRWNLFVVIVVSILLFLNGCKSNNDDFNGIRITTPYVSIEIDTITLKTNEQCVSGFIYHDMYYIYSLYYGYRLITFDRLGNIRNSSPLPERIDRHWMLDYSFKNDSLIALNENRGMTTYLLDKELGNWKLINRMEAPVYEDKDYRVLKTANGEWGGMVYFINKNTQEIYRAYSNEVVNVVKFHNKYYVTNTSWRSSIYEITYPEKMQKFHGLINDIVNNRAESNEKERYVFEGLKNVVDTSDFSISIAGSFIHKNRFLQLWNVRNEYNSKEVHITEFINGKLEHRYTFDFDTGIMGIKYLYFDGYKHFLNFDTKYREIFGAIEIDNDIIKIHFFKQEKE